MKVKKQFWRRALDFWNNPTYQECLSPQWLTTDRCSGVTRNCIHSQGHRKWILPSDIKETVDGVPDLITWVNPEKYKAVQGEILPVVPDR